MGFYQWVNMNCATGTVVELELMSVGPVYTKF